MVAIQLWAHLTGVPLDLRHQRGLSFVAGLVGEPKETDDFTKNLVSLTLSHVKVEVDLTKKLPDIVEFERDSGEVVEVLVHYPWLPPKCSHCHELGHIAKNCLLLPVPPKPVTNQPEKTQTKKVYQKKTSQADPSKSPVDPALSSQLEVSTKEPPPSQLGNCPNPEPIPQKHSSSSSVPCPLSKKPPLPLLPSSIKPLPKPFPPVIIALPATITPSGEPFQYSPPPIPKLSGLKRSRSHPNLLNHRDPSPLTALPSFEAKNPSLPSTPQKLPSFEPKNPPIPPLTLKNAFAPLTTSVLSVDPPKLGESKPSS
ncbi:unnamed protein product [Microthlaspi erraticum]|uniref:CCHC-type domain-containing protein n=1 Tax=Microthlaspi erraticum TaxID=1685480 RepID=A0A6D2JHG4_9BRAS|nr:unnamed protein product [Microthlaspi erraticum]